MDAKHRDRASRIRAAIANAAITPAEFRAALTSVPAVDRDAWGDLVFELDAPPPDDPALPRGCVPYLPCPVDALLRMVDHAGVRGDDVFVDVGSGVGRATAIVHLLTGARAIGLEIQPALVRSARALSTRLNTARLVSVEGDATDLAGLIATGSVFFLYCPFSGARLERLLAALEPIARTREIRVCCVDVPLPPCPWLALASPPAEDLAVYRSRVS